MTITAARYSRLSCFMRSQDLRLDGDVEGGGGLVGEQQLGIARQGDGDHHALAHAAGELVRVVLDAPGRLGDADRLQQLDGAFDGVRVRQAEVDLEPFGHEPLDAEHGVQAGDRVLEDHRDVVAADVAHLALGHRHEVAPEKLDGPADGRVVHHAREAEDGVRGDALAAARLTDEADELAGCDREAHLVDGVHDALVRREVDGEVGQAEKRVCINPHAPTSLPFALGLGEIGAAL